MLKISNSALDAEPKKLVVEFHSGGYRYEIYRTAITQRTEAMETDIELQFVPIKSGGLKSFTRTVDKEILRATLNNVGWNKSHASRLLGVTRTALIEKVKRYKIEEENRNDESNNR
jgi:DNA-binding NtrC family response regulator